MATTIKLKNSVTAAGTPSTLAQGEVAINVTDKKVWVGNAATTPVQLLGTGSDGNFTNLTVVNDASISGLTVGKGTNGVAGNTAFGTTSLAGSNSGGGENTAVGYESLAANTTGADQVGVGYRALAANTTGTENTSVGAASLRNNTTGGNNVAVGRSALNQNTTASNNTAVGYQAGYSTTTGASNLFMGPQAGYSNTTANVNLFIGQTSGYATTTGGSNVGVGFNTLYANTTGATNVAVGQQALTSNTTASNNTAVGYQAGYSNTTGTQGVFVGSYSGQSNTTGASNTFIGDYAGQSASTGSNNTYVGRASGYLMTTGNQNTILGGYNGNQGGLDIRTASNYIVLSDGAGNPRGIFDGNGNFIVGTTGGSAQLVVESSTNQPAGSFYTVGGSSGTPCMYVKKSPNDGSTSQVYFQFLYNNGSSGNGQINGNGSGSAAFGSYSDIRLKENITNIDSQLGNICALRPVEFDYKTGGHQIGFIAQEMQEIYPDAVGTSADDMLTITGWSKTEARLVKAIQELNAKVEAQALEIATLKGQ